MFRACGQPIDADGSCPVGHTTCSRSSLRGRTTVSEEAGAARSGPLAGYRIVELAGIGPAPFAAMLLSDLGADVVRIDRAAGAPPPYGGNDVIYRGRRSVAVDLKSAAGVEVVLRLAEQAHALLEPFRPGVAERLGVGPDVCHARNPRLVYGRMTGWGQEGPLAQKAGHDINYISIAGALWPMGSQGQPPLPPLNLVGDFGGGGMLLAVGVLAALLEAQQSGKGQVIDAAMVDGAALLMSFIWGMRAIDMWTDRRAANSLDGAAPYYRSYECSDGRYISVGAMEAQFYAQLVALTGLAGRGRCPLRTMRPAGRRFVTGWPPSSRRRRATSGSPSLKPYDACLTRCPRLRGGARTSASPGPRHVHRAERSRSTSTSAAIQPYPRRDPAAACHARGPYRRRAAGMAATARRRARAAAGERGGAMSDPVLYAVSERVATITLNRPEARNAVTMEMEDLLIARWAEAEADPAVGAIVLTGAGQGFCAGDDVKVQWSDPRMKDAVESLGTSTVGLSPFVEVMLRSTTPSVAAVNGAAVGLGMDLALLCDVRLATPSARFSQGYVRMGLVADIAGLWLLPRLVGPSVAAELLLTGDLVDADRALAIGLVSRVVPAGELLADAGALASRFAAMPPLAVAATKECLRRAVGVPTAALEDLAAIRGVRLRDLFRTEDHAEAVTAFGERRPAVFHGR